MTKVSNLQLLLIIALSAITVLLLGCNPTPTADSTFPYQITVKSSFTSNPIENAVVRLEVAGMAPLSSSSDSFGNVYITIPENYLSQSGRLVVEAPGFKRLQQNVPLMDAVPSAIFLKPLSGGLSSPSPTPTPTMPSTSAPSATPPPPTDVPSATPTLLPPSPTPTPSATDSPPPTATPTATATAIVALPQPSSQPQATELHPAPAGLSGKLAFPLKINDEYKVYVVKVSDVPPTQLYASIGNARQPQLSPDGKSLLVDGTGGGNFGAILQMGSDGRGTHPATCPAITVESYFPTWSPDGRRLAFDGGKIHVDRRQIYIDDIDEPGDYDCDIDDNYLPVQGGEAVDNNGLFPIWADDNWLYFRSCATWNNNPGICGIWATQVDGNGFDQITDNPNHLPTDADSRHLILMFNDNGNWDVYTVNSHTGGTPRNLTQNESTDIWGTLSPDGQTVAFMSNRGGAWAIWMMGIDGGNPRKWLAIDTFNWGTVAPDEIYLQRMSWSK